MTSPEVDPVVPTRRAYNTGASGYAAHSRDRSALANLRQRLLDLLPPQPLVLDLGSGPGHDAAHLAEAGATVFAFDAAQNLLREARVYRAIATRLVCGDSRKMPFAGESFDGIWSCASLLHLPHEEVSTALGEAMRVLKPGGSAFFSMSEGEQAGRVPVSDLGLATRGYYYHREEEWISLVSRADFDIIDHRVNRAAGNFNLGSTGWIETFAHKP